jgi:signal transduction histidine kinase
MKNRARHLRGLLTTVRVRLTVLAVLVVGLGLVAGGTIVATVVQNRLTMNAENDARQRASDTAMLIGTSSPPEVPTPAGRDRAVVQVVDRAGRIVAASPELRGRAPLVSEWPQPNIFTRRVINPGLSDESDYLVVGLVATAAGQPVAVYAASPLDPVGEGVEATSLALAIAIPVLLAVITATSWLLVGRALRPVEAMRSRVAEISSNELDRRVPEPVVQDELGRLARTMNAMLARLQEARDRQGRFVGDAAHELRSPVAAILARIEVGLAHTAGTDWVRLARDVHREATRLDRLAEELLELSRMDGHAEPERDQLVDMDELVLLEVDTVRARGRVTVDLSPFSAARISGRPDELRRVIGNLLDNAERHAASRVVVGLSIEDGSVELVVTDDGEGIAPLDRERVFERFARLQPARDRDSGGAGLGLAIVRDIVSAYGGCAWVADSGAGAVFRVRLPNALTGERRGQLYFFPTRGPWLR